MTTPFGSRFFEDSTPAQRSVQEALGGGSRPPFGQRFFPFEELEMNTRERVAFENQNKQENLDRLKEILNLPNITQQQVLRLRQMIRVLEGEYETNNFMDFVQGIGIGALDFGALGLVDLGSAIGQFLLPKAVEKAFGLAKLRDNVAESQAILRAGESFLGSAEGTAGKVGVVVGSLAGAMATFGGAHRLTGQALLRLAPKLGLLRSITTQTFGRTGVGPLKVAGKGLDAIAGTGAGLKTRMLADVLGGLGIDAIRASSLPGATSKQKLEQFGLDTGFGAAGSLLFNVIPMAFTLGKTRVKAAEAPTAEAKSKRAQEVDIKLAEGEARKLEIQLKRGAARTWESATNDMRKVLLPDATDNVLQKKYSELDDASKASILEQVRVDQTPAPKVEPGEGELSDEKLLDSIAAFRKQLEEDDLSLTDVQGKVRTDAEMRKALDDDLQDLLKIAKERDLAEFKDPKPDDDAIPEIVDSLRAKAKEIIDAAEKDLGPLERGQKIDLLLDQFADIIGKNTPGGKGGIGIQEATALVDDIAKAAKPKPLTPDEILKAVDPEFKDPKAAEFEANLDKAAKPKPELDESIERLKEIIAKIDKLKDIKKPTKVSKPVKVKAEDLLSPKNQAKQDMAKLFDEINADPAASAPLRITGDFLRQLTPEKALKAVREAIAKKATTNSKPILDLNRGRDPVDVANELGFLQDKLDAIVKATFEATPVKAIGDAELPSTLNMTLVRTILHRFGAGSFNGDEFARVMAFNKMMQAGLSREAGGALVSSEKAFFDELLQVLVRQGFLKEADGQFSVIYDSPVFRSLGQEFADIADAVTGKPVTIDIDDAIRRFDETGGLGDISPQKIAQMEDDLLGNPDAFSDMDEWLRAITQAFKRSGDSVIDEVVLRAIESKGSYEEVVVHKLRIMASIYADPQFDTGPLERQAAKRVSEALDRLFPVQGTIVTVKDLPRPAKDFLRGEEVVDAWMTKKGFTKRTLMELTKEELDELGSYLVKTADEVRVGGSDDAAVVAKNIERSKLTVDLIKEQKFPDIDVGTLDAQSVKSVAPPVGKPAFKLLDVDESLVTKSLDELDSLVDDLDKLLANDPNLSMEDFVHDVELIGRAKNVIKGKVDQLSGLDPEASSLPKNTPEGVEKFPTAPDPSDPTAKITSSAGPKKSDPINRMDKKIYQAQVKKYRKDPDSLSDADLGALERETINNILASADPDAKKDFQKLLDGIVQSQKQRRKFNPGNQSGLIAPELSAAITGSTVGFFLGMSQGDTIEDRLYNGVMTAAGFGLTLGALRRMRRPGAPAIKNLAEWETQLRKRVLSIEDEPTEASKGLLSWLENMYFQNVRKSFPLEKLYKLLGSDKLPFQQNAAKQLEMFGLWKRQSDAAIFIKPFKVLEDGNIVDADAMPLTAISRMVDGQTREFGEFLIAARSIEMFQTGRGTPPVDMLTARQAFINAPEKYHAAQREVLKYARWLADIGVEGGLISPELRNMFELDAFYIPLIRLFQGDSPSPAALVGAGGKKGAKGVKAKQPFGKLKTSERMVRNGFESLVENTPKVLRHAEFNRIAIQLANHMEALRQSGRKDLADFIMKPISATGLKADPATSASGATTRGQMDDMKEAMAGIGQDITDSQALAISQLFGDEPINVTDGTLTFFRNGEVERWRIHEDVAMALRATNSDEFSTLSQIMGMPAQLARVGITASPRFIFWQAFRDNFQLWFNSPEWFGYVPFIDQARGWWAIVSASPEYRKAVQGGLTGESLTAEGLKARRTVKGRQRSVLEDVKVGKGESLPEKLVASVKEMSPRKFYTDLVVPIADAARVGAYLRGRGRGKSVMEAVYTAKRVGVNYGQRGAHKMMHNLNHWTLFLNPSLQSVDEAARAFVRDPIKYTTKAFVGVTLPSIYLWMAYKDDEEIQELRQTESGRRFWWVRDSEDQIRKIPKPILDGQMWGSSVEAWLDKTKLENPTAISTWATALGEDAALHLLPTFFAVPASVAANYNLQFGGRISPESAQALDPEFQYNRSTSDAARIAGTALSPVSGPLSRSDNTALQALARAMSPAGLDYVVRNIGGEVRFEAVRALGQAWLYLTEPGFSVEAEEKVFVSSLTPRFPTTGAASIREFYTHARNFEQVYNTGIRKMETDPERGIDYVDQNFAEFSLAELTREGRAEVADLRAAIFDIEENPDLTRVEKREIVDALITSMIETTRAINESIRIVLKDVQ